CRQAVANVTPDSFLGKVRDAGPHGSSFPPALERPVNAPNRTGQQPMNSPSCPNLPPELAQHPKYRILRELGRGGMGVVYQARQTGMMERPVVIKVISRALIDQPAALERFQREVHAAAQLSHPNIVTAFDAEKAGDLHMLVMEFVPGQSLAEVLQKRGPLPVQFACHFARQVALGLQHAHERGMVHRDIKPQNLMLSLKNQVKILDFGLAKVVSERGTGKGLTASDAYMGTPDYSAPEQATDARSADIRADLYSLGCTLYCLLAGRPPFHEDTAMKTILAHLQQEPQPLPELRPDVPAELWQVLKRLLAKDPDQRFQKPIEVARALSVFVKPDAKGRPSPVLGAASPSKGTMVAADTNQLKKVLREVPGKTPRKEVPATLTESPFEELGDTSALPNKAKGARESRKRLPGGWYRPWTLLAGVGVLLLVLVGLLASGVFKLKTKEGTIVLENLPPDAEVLVDGGAVKVQSSDGKMFEVRVAPGNRRRLEVKKAGFKIFVEEVEIESGGRKPVVVRLVPEETPNKDKKKWVSLFNGKNLDGWKTHPKQPGDWRVVKGANGNVLTGSGATAGYLYSERGDYKDFHLLVEARINDGGCGGIYVRAASNPHVAEDKAWNPTGYEAWINMTREDIDKTIRLYVGDEGFVPSIHEAPVPPNKWFRMEVIAQGDRIIVKVNDTTTADYQDKKRRFTSGHIALEQFGAATEIEFRKIEIKELPANKSEAPPVVKPEPAEDPGKSAKSSNPQVPSRPAPDTDSLERKNMRPKVAMGKEDDAQAHCNLGSELSTRYDLDGAIAELSRAIQLKNDLHQAHCNLGWTLLKKRDTDGAIAELRRAIALNNDCAAGHCNLGFALRRQGRFAEALDALKRGDELGRKNPSWKEPSSRWVQDTARMAQLVERLPGVLKGEDPPSEPSDRLLLAEICRENKRLYGWAARLAEGAFKDKPSLAEDLTTGNRYDAARAAALAGCGKGTDARELDERERARWRRQALAWLRADLELRRKQLSGADVNTTREVRSNLRQWQKEPDLAGVRDDQAVAELPEAERPDWRNLWQEVRRAQEPSFAPLFNGTDLAGWRASSKPAWQVVQGSIKGTKPTPGPIGLWTTRTFANFHLRVETTIAQGNCSYIQFRQGSTGWYIVHIDGTRPSPGDHTGDLGFCTKGLTHPTSLAPANPVIPLKPGQWFTVEIIAKGAKLTVLIKGKVVASFEDQQRRFSFGVIHLVCRGNSKVHFRKVEIKEFD
ncbi:MAG TPA: family 16 glycoside hydrolase, partial [Gemmataceae bacterium]|nr:family 16 glycoside hydrolase [Gemmataceae bacterium]